MTSPTHAKLRQSIYFISKMDCAAEEQLIRMKLAEIKGIDRLEFDIAGRSLRVLHKNDVDKITRSIDGLNLNSRLLESTTIQAEAVPRVETAHQAKTLWAVLLINFGFFVIEMTTGLQSKSMGLVADSLDMFADAAVYGLSLLAIGKAISRKKLVAKLIGYLQFILAMGGFVEVLHRCFGFDSLPNFQTMIIVSLFALLANIASLYLLTKSASKEAHMRASMICTSNDIIVNAGVIVAGILVSVLASHIPDLAIGAVVFAIVCRGSLQILRLAK